MNVAVMIEQRRVYPKVRPEPGTDGGTGHG